MNVRVMGQSQDPLLVTEGPTAHWIRPKMLVDLMIEGRNVNALVDSGSQVNTITLTFVRQCGFPILPLADLVNHPLNLVGLGGKCMSPLWFVILCVQVREITGYDEDVVFLMVPNESEFGHRVPLVIGTCTIGRIINVIQESEVDCLYALGYGMNGTAAFLLEEHSSPHPREYWGSSIRGDQWGAPGSGHR